jgi:predicted nucleotidyltransferase
MHPERVREFLATFSVWAAEQPAIHAVALVGSYARGTANELSDVDLVIVTDDPATYVWDSAWSHTFGAVTRLQREEYGKVTSLRTWYDDGLEVEYGFTDVTWVEAPLDEGTQHVISSGLQVLFERDRILTDRIVGRERPASFRS